MKLLLSYLILFTVTLYPSLSQVITSSPEFPTVNDEITIYFHADQGDAGLKNYTGDIYAHTGLITDKSSSASDWKYVITDWTENTDKNKLVKVEDNLYKFMITPNIIDFYGVQDDEKVLKLAFVFRNDDGSVTGRDVNGGDIFYDVFDEGLNVRVNTPDNNSILEVNKEVAINISSTSATTTTLYINDTKITETSENEISYNWTPSSSGNYTIKAVAGDGNTTVVDSAWVYVFSSVPTADLPQGIKKGINYIDDNTVTLCLFAPYKKHVFVIGDFNNWLVGQDYIMNRTPDERTYWLTINNLEAGKEYAFQYLVDGTLKIADPYTDKVLDPWNDKYIKNETYPNLKPYPEGKTTEIVSVLQTAQQPYDWQVTDFNPPKETDMVIYEMLIRDFVATHTYKTVADTLDYLKNLGVNVLELMPVNEFEGNSSWGYNPSFYFAPDKYYGPKNELKYLVDEAHKRGIAVVIDMVLNHSFGQSPFVRLYWDSQNNRPSSLNFWYNVKSNFQNPDAQWGYDFNHESVYTQELVDSINSYWMSVYNVDGFRFDFTKGFSNTVYGINDWGSAYDADRIRILERMTDEIKIRKQDAYVIFEHLAVNSEEKELANYGILLWGNMNYNYLEAAMGWLSNSDFSWINYKKRSWNNPKVVGYMESHDEERMMYKNKQWGNSSGDYSIKDFYTALKRVELAATFFYTVPGPKMIWQFEELGYDYSIDYNGRTGEKPVKWDYFDKGARKRVYDVFSALAKIRIEQPAFETDNFNMTVSGAVKSIHLYHNDMDVVIIGNFDVVTQNINPDFPNAGTWYDYFSGYSVNIENPQQEITLAPSEYRIYTSKQLDKPDINPLVGDIRADTKILQVYPNPVAGKIFVENANLFTNITIINTYGQVVLTVISTDSFINIDNLRNGLYIIKGVDKSGIIYTTQFVKQ